MWQESTDHRGFPSQGTSNGDLWCFFDFSLKKLITEKLICRWDAIAAMSLITVMLVFRVGVEGVGSCCRRLGSILPAVLAFLILALLPTTSADDLCRAETYTQRVNIDGFITEIDLGQCAVVASYFIRLVYTLNNFTMLYIGVGEVFPWELLTEIMVMLKKYKTWHRKFNLGHERLPQISTISNEKSSSENNADSATKWSIILIA